MTLFEALRTHSWFLYLAVVLFGLCVGSFLNVVIYRLPKMMEAQWRAECASLAGEEPAAGEVFNLVHPRSRCPSCGTQITALQNVPVVSWLVLRGKCANCRAPISARYPIVELATGVLSGFLAWRYGYSLALAGALVFAWALLALALIDFDTQYLPDVITLPLLWLGLLVNLESAFATPRAALLGAVGGYLVLWSVYWGFKLLAKKEGMGYGDFKLLAGLGAWMGATMLLPIIIFASGVGALFGIVIMIRQRKGRETQIAFGPFLAIAGWIALVAGNDIVTHYLALFARHP